MVVDENFRCLRDDKATGVDTGLGLSVTASSMKSHAGVFTIRSEPGEMTEMILTFTVD